MTEPKILFLVSEDWYFWSHRLPLAQAVRDRGWSVSIATRVSSLAEQIRKQGLLLTPLSRFTRGFKGPWHELQAFWEILQIYKQEQPTIVHQVALKPVIYGTVAARLLGVPLIVNALAGLGFLFISEKTGVSLIKRIVIVILRLLFSSDKVRLIIQNPDDLDLLLSTGIISKDRVILIRGSGVNLDDFAPKPEPSGVTLVVLASRMLWDKGIKEFVEAARLINDGKDKKAARFVLVGVPDPENPASISEQQLCEWQSENVVEWWGYRADMPAVFAQTHIACLPSYREGLPKVLLEAAASGRAIVATDVTGCREIVRHGENGLLVPVKDPKALAQAIDTLITNPSQCQRMGTQGRKLVVQQFSQERIIQETLAVYDESLKYQRNQP